MLGSVLYSHLFHLIFPPALGGRGIIVSDFQMTKLKHTEVKQLSRNTQQVTEPGFNSRTT